MSWRGRRAPSDQISHAEAEAALTRLERQARTIHEGLEVRLKADPEARHLLRSEALAFGRWVGVKQSRAALYGVRRWRILDDKR
jgi:hypothetical protein